MVQSDLSIVVIRIKTLTKTALDLYQTDLTPRLVSWSISALEKEGMSQEHIAQLLGDRDLKGQWWILRQILSDRAIESLERKLSAFVESMRNG